MRKIIQIVAVPPTPHLHDGYLVALCDDGTLTGQCSGKDRSNG
jgi:hypothetical protein